MMTICRRVGFRSCRTKFPRIPHKRAQYYSSAFSCRPAPGSPLCTPPEGCCQHPPPASAAGATATHSLNSAVNPQSCKWFAGSVFPKRKLRVSPHQPGYIYLRAVLFCLTSLAKYSSSFCRAFMSWDSSGLGSTFSTFTALGQGEVPSRILSTPLPAWPLNWNPSDQSVESGPL